MPDNNSSTKQFVVAAMYKFVTLTDFNILRAPLLERCEKQGLKGTILLADEGINGTVAGSREGIDHVLDFLRADARFADLVHKESFVDEIPFYRMKVKLKKEIVSMGIVGINAEQTTGIKVDSAEWNKLILDPDILLIDTRNEYECEIGTFRNAMSPKMKSLREFPAFVNKELDPEKHKKVAMFCTGGIRCEKASSYMLSRGFNEVYQLKGGILQYLEKTRPEESMWEGECFVFDGRVTIDELLEEGKFEQCFACRRPLSERDRKPEHYKKGISCPYCFDKISKTKRAGLIERQRQVELAEKRNQQHIGIPINSKSS